ncbi:MAG: FtsH protease activity modulator HflK [Rhodothalassiaceae bacterium]
MAWQNNGGGWQGGGRGPWGSGPQGPRGPQQPPNLDDIVRKGQDRLKRILPGPVGGRAGVFLLLLFIVLLWVASGIYRVGANEQGVVLRFGKWVETTGPGLHWHIPWPIETALTPPVTDRKRVDIGFQQGITGRGRTANMLEESLMLTGDENIVDNSFTVFWRIKDAGLYLFNIQSPQETTVKSVAESVMREIIGKTPIQSALTEGRQAIERDARERIQAVLDNYEAGITVIEVKLEKVDPPGQVIDAFRDVQAAEADRERFRNEADRYANQIIPEARGRANQVIQEAEAYREQVIARAQGEADRFLSVYEQYKLAKDVTKKRIYLETMEEILRDMDKVIMDGGAANGVVPYLALPELKKRSAAGGGQ